MMSEPGGGRRRRGDGVAAAIGNASLLGVGYVLLGRRGLALGALAGTLLLLVVLGLSGSRVVEVLVVLWWAAMVVHGWLLGRGQERDVRARGIAAAVTVVVLVVVTALRIGADSAAGEVERARASGDCSAAERALGGVGLAARLANAPAAAEGDGTTEVCARLASARSAVDRALQGDATALGTATAELNRVERLPAGHERMVEAALEGAVAAAARTRSCGGVGVAEWLSGRVVRMPPQVSAAADAASPAILVACGEERLRLGDLAGADARFRQAVQFEPAGPAQDDARRGLDDVAAARAGADVTRRLSGYCRAAFPYPAAPAPGSGSPVYVDVPGYDSNPASPVLALPAQRITKNAGAAAHAVCGGPRERGSVARSCDYTVGPVQVRTVRFFRTAYTVRVYEVRTGAVVLDRRIEVGGGECPPTLPYDARYSTGPLDQDLPVGDDEVPDALNRIVLPLVG